MTSSARAPSLDPPRKDAVVDGYHHVDPRGRSWQLESATSDDAGHVLKPFRLVGPLGVVHESRDRFLWPIATSHDGAWMVVMIDGASSPSLAEILVVSERGESWTVPRSGSMERHFPHVRGAVSADGRVVAWCDGKGSPLLRATRGDPAPEEVAPGSEPATVSTLAFSPDGATLAAGRSDGRIDLFGGRPGALRGHRGPVRSLRIAPGGDRLLSTGADRTAVAWDLRAP